MRDPLPMPLVGVVIPAWNATDYTLACLDSLKALDYPAVEIVVVDNGSTDGACERVRAAHPDVTLIRNETNRGFAFACNQGLAEAFGRGCEYAFLLNNDTIVAPDLLTQLLLVAETRPNAAMFGPRICYAAQPDKPWFTGMRFPRPIYIVRTQPEHQVQSVRPEPVDFISGCGMLIARRLYKRIGGLNEAYFMYYEDLDYCLTARKAGFDIVYVPSARMWHAVSVSSGGKDSPLKQYFQIKSAVLFTRRHTHGLWRPINLGIRFAHAGYTAAGHLLRGRLQWAAIREYARGLREATDTRGDGRA